MGPRTTALLAAILLTLATPGCGLIMLTTHQPVEVVTDPEGAELYVDGKKHDEVGPTTISVFRGQDHKLDAKLGDKKGGTSLTQRLVIPVVLLDFCTLGVGLLIDYISGTLYDFEPSVKINLGKAPPPSAARAPVPAPAKPTPPSADAAPCSLCGEPRGDESPCPHCGME